MMNNFCSQGWWSQHFPHNPAIANGTVLHLEWEGLTVKTLFLSLGCQSSFRVRGKAHNIKCAWNYRKHACMPGLLYLRKLILRYLIYITILVVKLKNNVIKGQHVITGERNPGSSSHSFSYRKLSEGSTPKGWCLSSSCSWTSITAETRSLGWLWP